MRDKTFEGGGIFYFPLRIAIMKEDSVNMVGGHHDKTTKSKYITSDILDSLLVRSTLERQRCTDWLFLSRVLCHDYRCGSRLVCGNIAF